LFLPLRGPVRRLGQTMSAPERARLMTYGPSASGPNSPQGDNVLIGQKSSVPGGKIPPLIAAEATSQAFA